jgi:hypothetical protein
MLRLVNHPAQSDLDLKQHVRKERVLAMLPLRMSTPAAADLAAREVHHASASNPDLLGPAKK